MTRSCSVELDPPPSAAVRAERQALEQAFHAFNELSQELSGTYRALEARVAELTARLECERDGRLKELAGKEQLANRLTRLLAALPAGVVVLDGEGRVRETNPAACLMLNASLTGESWREIVARRFIADGARGVRVRNRNGEETVADLHVSVATCALMDEPGQIVLIHDVSEQRALEERVARQERMSAMGEMAASLAHQIRTPLATAMLHVSRWRQSAAGGDVRPAERIHASLKHLERLVNDMLIFARGGAPANALLPVAELLAEAARAAESAASGARVTMCDTTAGAVIHGNREALIGALVNLIANARQAGAQAIELSATQENGAVVVRVSDDGPGVREEMRERVFEPFFTTRAQGTGLGLAVVRAVVRAHGGDISCAASTLGGAQFRVCLPPFDGAAS